MERDKLKFVSEILKYKSIKAGQIDKIFGLIIKEEDSLESEINQIKIDILQLKNSINLKHKRSSIENITKSKPLIEHSDLPKYIDPRHASKFIREFNQNPILKYTCHNVDEDGLQILNGILNTESYEFEKFLSKVKSDYAELLDRYKNFIARSVVGLFSEYINGYLVETKKKGWSSDNIEVNWSSPELSSWCTENNQCPNPDETVDEIGYEIIPTTLKNKLTLNTFSEVVLHFKKQIQFRIGHSILDMIKLENGKFSNCKFDITAVRENIQFFCNTDKVAQGYKRILQMCFDYQWFINQHIPAEFKISLEENKILDENVVILSVHHLNSSYGKTLNQLSERYGENLHSMIKNQINGVCDLRLTADFNNYEFAEISLWSKNKQITKIQAFQGVKFDLIFFT